MGGPTGLLSLCQILVPVTILYTLTGKNTGLCVAYFGVFNKWAQQRITKDWIWETTMRFGAFTYQGIGNSGIMQGLSLRNLPLPL